MTTREVATRGEATTLTRAHALIEAAEKATPSPWFNVSHYATFIAAARNDAPDIARALVEAMAMLREVAPILDREDLHRTAALVRAFLAQHDGKRE